MTDGESESTARGDSGEPAGSVGEDGPGPSWATVDGTDGVEGDRPGEEDPVETEGGATGAGPRGRDVEVPFEVYKAVTVFSTLFAVGAVVVGFVLLDWGTERATADLSDVNVAITVAGLASIALGAATYAFSTRFRARGMGNAKDGAD